MRVLNAVVEPPARLLFFECAHFSKCGLVGCEAICDDLFGTAMPLHQFPEEFQCCGFVSALRDDGFQHLSFVIYGAPEIMSLSIHLHKNLFHVPLPFRECSQLLHPLSPDLGGKHRPETVPPVADGFVTDIDASLVQQVFDIPQGKRKPDVQHHRQADDLGTGFEILERGRFVHSQTLRKPPARLNPSSSDKAPGCTFRNHSKLPRAQPDVQHHSKANDLGTGFKVLEGGRFVHSQTLCNRPAPLNPCSSDKTDP